MNALRGQERTSQLAAAAAAEGSLAIYTSNTDIDKVVDGFKEKYPKIKVNVYRANSETVLQRVLQEQKAGFYGNDILETNAGELDITARDGYLADYRSEYRDKVRKDGQRKDWTASRFNVFVIGWNTKLVKPGEEPRSLEELADPKWKGRISMELSDVDWFTTMYGYYQRQGRSDAQIRDLFARIAANAKVVKGHTVQGDLLAAGQFAVAVSPTATPSTSWPTKGHRCRGARPRARPSSRWSRGPTASPVMRAAKHPAAAMLFVDYELTDTQAIFAKAFRVGSVPTAKDPLAGLSTIPSPMTSSSPSRRSETTSTPRSSSGVSRSSREAPGRPREREPVDGGRVAGLTVADLSGGSSNSVTGSISTRMVSSRLSNMWTRTTLAVACGSALWCECHRKSSRKVVRLLVAAPLLQQRRPPPLLHVIVGEPGRHRGRHRPPSRACIGLMVSQ